MRQVLKDPHGKRRTTLAVVGVGWGGKIHKIRVQTIKAVKQLTLKPTRRNFKHSPRR